MRFGHSSSRLRENSRFLPLPSFLLTHGVCPQYYVGYNKRHTKGLDIAVMLSTGCLYSERVFDTEQKIICPAAIHSREDES